MIRGAGSTPGRRLSRREFLAAAGAATLALPSVASGRRRPIRPPLPAASWQRLPRWRGFNLTELGSVGWGEAGRPYRQWDFDFIAKHGFNFVRLPLDYRFWTPATGGSRGVLRHVDRAVALAATRKIHVNLALFNAPGRVDSFGSQEPEGLDLWADGAGGDEARRLFAEQWRMLAERYRGVQSIRLSFNLLNEPGGPSLWPLDRSGQQRAYLRAASVAVAAIREVDPARLIIADALPPWGVVRGFPRTVEGFVDPVEALYDLQIGQSLHCYLPTLLTHYGVEYIAEAKAWPIPDWPYMSSSSEVGEDWVLPGPWDRARVAEMLNRWRAVIDAGIGVHVGEFGCYNRTPHRVALAWMRDVLSLFRELGVGWALWNLRGSFGVVDSSRADVAYRSDGGYGIDRAMLNLLKSS